MKIIFGTTNERKKEDLQNLIKKMKLDIQVLSMDDIGWDRGEIEENGSTLEENSLIKAKAVLSFCKDNNISYPIITDDGGLFVDSLNGEPGIYTARYADDERENDPSLPKYQNVIKLLRNMKEIDNRRATFKCCVTLMMLDGKYHQELGESHGTIAREMSGEIKKPYFFTVFILDGKSVTFNQLSDEELDNTYRNNAIRKTLKYYKQD